MGKQQKVNTIKDPYLFRKLGKAELHNADDREIDRRIVVSKQTREAGKQGRN